MTTATTGAVMVFRDVSSAGEPTRALGAAYRELEAKAAELRRSNEDLSQFAYVASHDLRSPLKTVTMYSQLLQRRYSDKLDCDGMELLAEIESATKRLGSLIEDLLAFSTVTSNPEYPTEAGSMPTLLCKYCPSTIFTALSLNPNATVDSEPLPKLNIDTTNLVQLFQNLVANAIRYRSAAPPHIWISATQEGAFWHYLLSR